MFTSADSLRAVPSELDADTWYPPESAEVTRWRARIRLVAPSMGIPSRNHWKTGSGEPITDAPRIKGLPGGKVTARGWLRITGACSRTTANPKVGPATLSPQ